MYKDVQAAKLLGVANNKLRQEFTDRQISPKTYQSLDKARFIPYFPSEDIQARFAEIARNIGEINPFQSALPTLNILRNNFNFLNLNSNFNDFIDPADYLIPDVPTAAPSIPQTGPVITPPRTSQVIPGSGLTATETALLSPEEQIIRARTRRT